MSITRKAQRFGLSTFITAAATAIMVALASPAFAAPNTIELKEAHKGKLATFFEENCDQVPGGPIEGKDGWVFVLPASVGAEGNFITLTVTFKDLNGATQIRQIPGPDAGIVTGSGDNKAYIITPAGWTLVDATAVVEGGKEDGEFNVTHTCPGTEVGTSPSPSTSTSPSTSPSGSTGPSTSPSGSVSPTTSAPAPTTTTTSPGGLPVTGSPLTWVLITGVALAAAGGAALLIVRRRRAAGEGPEVY